VSGHFYFRDNWYADSAVLAAVLVLGRLSREERPFSEILRPLRRYFPTGEVNFEVEDKDGKIREIAKAFADAEVDFLDGVSVHYPDWWFNVRKSNTEPLLRGIRPSLGAGRASPAPTPAPAVPADARRGRAASFEGRCRDVRTRREQAPALRGLRPSGVHS
jgi:hypothetical protein